MTKKKSARRKSSLMTEIARRVGDAAGTVVNATQAFAGAASSVIADRKKKSAPARPARKKTPVIEKKRVQKKPVAVKSKKRGSR